MALFDKHFTLEEARAELPALRRQLQRVQELIAELEQGQIEMQRIQQLIRSNGYGSQLPDYGQQIGEIQEIVGQILERGIQVKDLQRGLIDFPHWREGEEVLLCWLADENDISYWHTLDGGFAGRTPI